VEKQILAHFRNNFSKMERKFINHQLNDDLREKEKRRKQQKQKNIQKTTV